MKVCTIEHVSPLFGRIPVGSLWTDDSPYVLDDFAHCFDEVEPEPVAEPAPKVIRKFGEKKGDA